MNYKDLLNRTIETSGLKNIEIIAKMKDDGITITPNYFSVLRNGDNKIASDEVSRAIAKACGAPEELLVIQGQLDKTSGILKDYIEFSVSNITQTPKALLETLPDELKQRALKELENKCTADVICEIMSNKEFMQKTSDELFKGIKYEKPKYALVPLGKGEIRIVDEDSLPV